MGRKPRTRGRHLNGVFLLDKPAGLTSNAALQEVKRLFQAAKAGHTGSLDPIATGLLPICFGECTKLSSFFLEADKHYEAILKLGIATDTGDSEGSAQYTKPVDINNRLLNEAISSFHGEIRQIPPMHSAIKKNGKPLYELARQGIEIEREPRNVKVFSINWETVTPNEILIRLHCSSGFYVRSLARDIGECLGCGAHVTALRRTGVGDFKLSDAIDIEKLQTLATDIEQLDSLLISGDQALSHIPKVTLGVDAAYYLCRGQPVRAANAPGTGLVRLYAEEVGFLGVGKVLGDGRVAPKRLFQSS